MDTAIRQTKLGQASLLAVAFTTPFAVVAGTGGYPQAQPVEVSGGCVFVIGAHRPTLDEIERAKFFREFSRLIDEYGLEKKQAAALLNVSRPTVYSWLEKGPELIRGAHRERLLSLMAALDANIDPSLRLLLGGLLQKRIDPYVRDLFAIVSNGEESADQLKEILATLNFRLSGIESLNRLSHSLKDKKPLI
jgi:predicted XRE-type DNA-binding protein